ncbi:acyltransferase family protein [Promethearchaeum syntrophicum]|uniref:Acyltransferase family protein n=1 Tax=Promethearchaeum syntrophicum TaxID=2594042 RepID=A0A5B9DF61_9ARCH|nr:acyltransferase [Candidatus Prometheoarchaeum syntrophicum]QEE17366.1 Acyltransferase family protein [Candidatus Prometheoarchaeum syntrophicum]
MKNENRPELDILRIISCLIVIVLIHIPNNYAYTFYMDLSQYTGYLIHTLGISVAMGSFIFISGFSLYLSESNRKLNSKEKIKNFLKKRFLRIFPLYWFALIVYLLIFPDTGRTVIFEIAHVFGLQMIFAPMGGDPIWTIWFIGIIVIYYLIFMLLSYLDSLKKIIPVSILIQAGFVTLNILFDLVEYRFFQYYNIFILGIIMSKIYISPQFTKVKESLIKKNKNLPLIIVCVMVLISIPLYFVLARYTHTSFLSNYGTYYLFQIVARQPGYFEVASAFLLRQLNIVLFLIGILSLLYLVMKILHKIFKKEKINKIISVVAYSTFGAYLFHRPIIILLSIIVTGIFNVNMYARENFYIALLFVPIIFLFSYGLQKTSDRAIALFKKRKHKKIDEIKEIVEIESPSITEKSSTLT